MQSRVTVEGWQKGEIERGQVDVEILDCPHTSISMTNKLVQDWWTCMTIDLELEQFNVLYKLASYTYQIVQIQLDSTIQIQFCCAMLSQICQTNSLVIIINSSWQL